MSIVEENGHKIGSMGGSEPPPREATLLSSGQPEPILANSSSNSIQNQRLMLEKYAADNGFENTLFLSDDGYSGTNFNRPA